MSRTTAYHLSDGMFLAKERMEQDDLEAYRLAQMSPGERAQRDAELQAALKESDARDRAHRHAEARKIINDPYESASRKAMARTWLEY